MLSCELNVNFSKNNVYWVVWVVKKGKIKDKL